MKRLIVIIILSLGAACAGNPPPVASPASDPVRVADGLRVANYDPARSLMLDMRATAAALGPPFLLPINTSGIVAFCSADQLWLSRAPADKWYQVNVDGSKWDWLGPLLNESPNCFRTTNGLVFSEPGSHTVTVQLVTPGPLVVLDPGSTSTECVVGADCFGLASEPVGVQVVNRFAPGPPPPIQNGQVTR